MRLGECCESSTPFVVNNLEGLLRTGLANAAKQRGGGKAGSFAEVSHISSMCKLYNLSE